jgi:hypothetical protein
MTRILHTKVETGQQLLASDITNLTFFPVGTILMMDSSWTNGRGGWYICDGQNGTPDLRDKFIKGSGSETTAGANWLSLTTSNLPSHDHSLTNMSLSGLQIGEGGAHGHAGSSATASDSGAHGHTFSNGAAATGGSHNHALAVTGANDNNHSGGEGNGAADTDAGFHDDSYTKDAGSHTHTVTGTISDVVAHTHTITVGVAEGGSHTHTVSGGTISGSVSSSGTGTQFNNMPAYYAVIYIKKVKEYV